MHKVYSEEEIKELEKERDELFKLGAPIIHLAWRPQGYAGEAPYVNPGRIALCDFRLDEFEIGCTCHYKPPGCGQRQPLFPCSCRDYTRGGKELVINLLDAPMLGVKENIDIIVNLYSSYGFYVTANPLRPWTGYGQDYITSAGSVPKDKDDETPGYISYKDEWGWLMNDSNTCWGSY